LSSLEPKDLAEAGAAASFDIEGEDFKSLYSNTEADSIEHSPTVPLGYRSSVVVQTNSSDLFMANTIIQTAAGSDIVAITMERLNFVAI
jgi:hypothetical protein